MSWLGDECPWCESNEVSEMDNGELPDDTEDAVNKALGFTGHSLDMGVEGGNFTEYECEDCGCVYRVLSMRVTGQVIIKRGDPSKSIEVG